MVDLVAEALVEQMTEARVAQIMPEGAGVAAAPGTSGVVVDQRQETPVAMAGVAEGGRTT